jgi:hypothetical protein
MQEVKVQVQEVAVEVDWVQVEDLAMEVEVVQAMAH